MRFRSLVYFVVLLAALQARVAHADQTFVKTNANPAICNPIQNALFFMHDYLTYNPDTAQAVMELPRVQLMTRPPIYPPPWPTGPLDWGGFKQDNAAKVNALLDAGETYDHTYIVYTTPVDFYGEAQPRPVYRLTHLRSAKLPEIFVQDDGSALSEGLKKLGPSDLFIYGPRAYPVVRKPGEVMLYEIDTDQPGKETFEQKKFIPVLICDFVDGSTTQQ